MRPIDADELLTAFPVDDEPTLTKSCVRMTIQHMPTVDAVPRGAYDQVRWERDIALGQLKQLGYGLGEKVDAVPVVHGRWKAVTEDMVTYKRICSCCGKEAPYDIRDEDPLSEGYYMLYPYCPMCGAKMDGKDGDNG